MTAARSKQAKARPLTKAQVERFDRLVEELSVRAAAWLGCVDDHYLKTEPYLSEDGQKADRFFEIASGGLTVRVSVTATRNEDA